MMLISSNHPKKIPVDLGYVVEIATSYYFSGRMYMLTSVFFKGFPWNLNNDNREYITDAPVV